MLKKSMLLLSLFLLLAFSISWASQNKCELKVKIYGFESNKGNCRILIFKKGQEEHFPGEFKKAFIKKFVTINNKKVVYTFKDLPYGTYAVSVHHDEDNDGELSTNWIGMPKEGLGASNDAKGSFGPPSFEDASITLNSPTKAITINLVHL